MLYYINIRKTADGHYAISGRDVNPVTNKTVREYIGIESARRFSTAIAEAQKMARANEKEPNATTYLRVTGGSKAQNGSFVYKGGKFWRK